MKTYAEQRDWADRYVDTFRQIVGPYLLCPSTLEQDQLQATDLVVLTGRNMTIACRVRDPKYRDSNAHEFTIRNTLPSGTKTEMCKIVDGWADWMVYGFATGQGIEINPWYLINLKHFRIHWFNHWNQRELHDRRAKNRDGTGLQWVEQWNDDGSSFLAFEVSSFSAGPKLLIDKAPTGWPDWLIKEWSDAVAARA
jgi:hypothetical protein